MNRKSDLKSAPASLSDTHREPLLGSPIAPPAEKKGRVGETSEMEVNNAADQVDQVVDSETKGFVSAGNLVGAGAGLGSGGGVVSSDDVAGGGSSAGGIAEGGGKADPTGKGDGGVPGH